MGGTMPYSRLVSRNQLDCGDYNAPQNDRLVAKLGLIRGDLRRFEDDSLEQPMVDALVRASGATHAQVRRLVRFMLGIEEPGCEECEVQLARYRVNQPDLRHARCYFHSNWSPPSAEKPERPKLRSKDMTTGTRLRACNNRDVVVTLGQRKSPLEPWPGWWLLPPGGGLADFVIDRGDWVVVEDGE